MFTNTQTKQCIKGGGIIAKKIKTRDEKIIDAINAPINLDVTVDIKIPRSNQTVDKKFKCSCCGASWDNPKTHFSKSASPLFQSNDGYINICNSCRDAYYYRLVDLYNGNEAHAIRHFCQQFDIIFHIDALTASRQISADRSRISHYQAKKNLGQTARVGSTYIEGMKYDYQNKLDNVIESREQVKSEYYTVSASAIDRWGIGLTEEDYRNLDDHYRTIKKSNPNTDNNQEIFIKSLCHLNLLMTKALKGNDLDGYTKANSEYAKTFKQAGLRTVEEKDSSNDETFCMTLGFISDYTPEEFYQDKELYADFDKIGEYIERHITRPMINLETGSDVRDKEYFVPEGEEYEEE